MNTNEEPIHLRFTRIIDDMFPATLFSEAHRAEILNRFLLAANPPIQKMSQANMDEADLQALFSTQFKPWSPYAGPAWNGAEWGWNEAIQRERAWFRAELEKIFPSDETTVRSVTLGELESVRRLRNRCKETP